MSVIENLFAERFQGFILLSGDVVCPSMEPESPIRELFCCNCHACLLKDFLPLICHFSEGMAGFYKKSYWNIRLKKPPYSRLKSRVCGG